MERRRNWPDPPSLTYHAASFAPARRWRCSAANLTSRPNIWPRCPPVRRASPHKFMFAVAAVGGLEERGTRTSVDG
jgi:hypothetical protein